MTILQKKASDPEYFVWVAASAGTGKTTVLTKRVLRLMLAGTNPGRILCLTFTKAAAAEMHNRIHKELSKWVILSEEDLIKDIIKLTDKAPSKDEITLARKLFATVIDTPDGLKIQTIHSFCQNLMKRFPLEAQIAPYFTVIDEQTSLELLEEARIRLITEKSQHDKIIADALSNIIWRLNEDSFTSLMHQMMSQRGKLETLFGRYRTDNKFSPENLIKRIYETLGVASGTTKEDIAKKFISSSDEEGLRYSLKAMLEGGKTDKKNAVILAKWLESSPEDNIKLLDEYKGIFLTKEGDARAKVMTQAALKKFAGADAPMLIEQARVVRYEDDVKSAAIAQLTVDLTHVCESVLEIYHKLKASRAFLDYNDLILITSKLLHRPDIAPWVLFKLDGGIDHLLVDEAQDTSSEQWKVIEAISEEFFSGESASKVKRTIFVVGDEKQSIFSFQGANPKLFSSMHDSFSIKTENADKKWASIDLDTSFRSTEAILNSVDEIFKNDELRSHISIKSGQIKHIANRIGQPGIFEVWPLTEAEEAEKIIPWTPPVTRRENSSPEKILANQIADKINDWLESGRILQSYNRPVEAGDIMILVKSRTKLVDYMVKALKQRNIPVAGVDRMVLTEHIAIMDLIALGNFLLLPSDDLTCATILKSPLIGLTEEELFKLAYGRQENTIWQQLKAKSNESKSFSKAYNYLLDLLNRADFTTPFELFSYIIEASGGRRKIISRLGYEANDPIDEFLSLTMTYESSHIPSLQGFLHWIINGQIVIKRDMEQGQNVVRIMTVHGSKGLQAPIVFMPDTTSGLGKTESVLWSQDEDPLFFWAAGAPNENNFCKDLKQKIKDNSYKEHIRLLYVALTRAEDELYICGKKTQKSPSEKCWYDIIKDGINNIATQDGEYLRVGGNFAAKIPVNANEPISDAGNSDSISNASLPDFLTRKPAEEPTPTIPLTPSRPESDDPAPKSPLGKSSLLRGKVIHKLLEYLPDINTDLRCDIAMKFLEKYKNDFSANESAEILSSVLAVLNDENSKYIFEGESKAEVPIIGTIGNYVLSGQIDRLVIREDKIIIIDYKTNRTAPSDEKDIHPNYLKQMAAYRSVLQEIYPEKAIECALVWTEGPAIMKLTDSLLDSYRKL